MMYKQLIFNCWEYVLNVALLSYIIFNLFKPWVIEHDIEKKYTLSGE